MKKNINVCTEVVEHDLCIGCGMCAGVCPKGTLQIQWNDYGGYSPQDTKSRCSESCHMCLRACPFYDQDDNEDTIANELYGNIPGIRYKPEAGYYLNNYVGYSNVADHRKNGASGGLATWLLETMLEKDLVDQVVCVSPVRGPEVLFKYVICNTTEEIRKCSKSAYYPVEMSEVIRHILNNDGRYAITVTPCFAKAIRLAMRDMKILRKRIKYIIGLGCSLAQSRYLAEYVCAAGGGDPFNVEEFEFRIKTPEREPHDFGIRFASNIDTEQEKRGMLHLHSLFRAFSINACYFCDDLFAEVSDVMVKDAWMDPYEKDYRGHSVMLIRKKEIQELLQRGIDSGELVCKAISITDVLNSQRGEKIPPKRNIAAAIRSVAARRGYKVPRKRQPFSKTHFAFKIAIRQKWNVERQSRIEWPKSGRNVEKYTKAMEPYMRRFKWAGYLYFATKNPLKIPRMFLRKLIKLIRRG